MFNPLKAIVSLFRGVPDDVLLNNLQTPDGWRDPGTCYALPRAERRRRTRKRKEAHRIAMVRKGLKGGKRRV